MVHRVVVFVLVISLSSVFSLNETEAPAALSVCSAEGFKCIDSCTKLIRCFINGNNTFSQQVIRNCPSEIGKLCNLATKDCSSSFCEDEKLDSQPITCHEDGVFPHPSNCKAYYTCANGVFNFQVCPKGTAYNGATEKCTAEVLDERPCQERPIPKCESLEDMGSYKENSTIFYVCAYNSGGYLLPELRRCQATYHFVDDEKRCNSAAVFGGSFVFLIGILVFNVVKDS